MRPMLDIMSVFRVNVIVSAWSLNVVIKNCDLFYKIYFSLSLCRTPDNVGCATCRFAITVPIFRRLSLVRSVLTKSHAGAVRGQIHRPRRRAQLWIRSDA
ncbi:hypothetical protein BN2476_1530020 [Paraburkholderia piptadeniae]|uniref:Uncharacterized protein n=1 Tax=Paraburkholderia piptadeniae TaxID=1701573 RepID=A0A1N7SX26_9BURK|nr:hypothetical protein BN2476_1530020 [Paraburkholderia piptadeniae]